MLLSGKSHTAADDHALVAQLCFQPPMPKITALIHTHNDGQRLGRALESLRVADQVLIIDDASTDNTAEVAREHGATLKSAVPGVDYGVYVVDAANDWILALRPDESLSEALEADLFEWKSTAEPEIPAFAFPIRQETEHGWELCPPEARLVDRRRVNWEGKLPPNNPAARVIPGEILRFRAP